MKLITLTTDFGLQDWFVATMKGVILSICPGVEIVDISHAVPRGDVRAGAIALWASYRYFPKGTAHVAVVDPGVGSLRAAIAVRTGDHLFIGPDNGVLSLALEKEKVRSVRRLENPRCFLQPVSRTFHGRDIFAPVAARLCRGFPFHKLGPPQQDFVRIAWPRPHMTKGAIEGEIVHIDRFGNLITNIGGQCLRDEHTARSMIKVGKRKIPVGAYYQSVAAGKPVAVIGSSGLLEIAINGGSAARVLGLKVGTKLRVIGK